MAEAESRYPYIRITIRPPDPLPKGVIAKANLAVLDTWIQDRLPWVGKLRVFSEGNQTIVVGQWDQNAIADWWASEGPGDE
jgi:hypothetical protein